MKKNIIIPFILLFSSSFTFAQSTVKIGEDSQGIYQVKQDSFAVYKEKNIKYVSLTVQIILANKTKPEGQAHYKMLESDCSNTANFNLYRINDYDTNIISTHITKFDENNIHSSIAGAICNYSEEVDLNPEINKNSLQSLHIYAQHAPDNEWSIPMEVSENKFLTLTNSINFEDKYVSIIAKLQYPAKSTDYYKIYIDRNYCKQKKGYLEIKTMDTLKAELEDIPFNFKKTPEDLTDLIFHNIAKTMCEYTIKYYKHK